MKPHYVRAALTIAVISFAGLALAACGANPGQTTGGAPPIGGIDAGGILGMLVSQVLPLVLGSTGVGGAVAAGIPIVLNLLRGMKANASKAEIGVENDALAGILQLLPLAADAVKARVDGEPGDGVAVLKGLFADRIASLNIGDDTLAKLVKAAVAKQSATPPATPAP